jgi:virulence-associated protein VagC
MAEAQLIELDGDQVVLLPAEFQLSCSRVRIAKSGDAIILTLVRGRLTVVIEWLRSRLSTGRQR